MKINLHNMDCMEAMSGMEDNQYDLAIVDPPYGIGEFWKKNRRSQYKRSHDWNQKIPNKEYFDQLFRVSKNQIIWGGNYFTEHLQATNSWIVWDKGTDVEKVFMSECELTWKRFLCLSANWPGRLLISRPGFISANGQAHEKDRKQESKPSIHASGR